MCTKAVTPNQIFCGNNDFQMYQIDFLRINWPWRPNIWNIGGGSLPEFLMQPTMVLSLLQARLGPKTTARFAAVILFMSHLKIHSYLFSIALFLRFHIGSAKTNRHCWITNLQVFLRFKNKKQPVDNQRDELDQELEDHVVLIGQLLDHQVLTEM